MVARPEGVAAQALLGKCTCVCRVLYGRVTHHEGAVQVNHVPVGQPRVQLHLPLEHVHDVLWHSAGKVHLERNGVVGVEAVGLRTGCGCARAGVLVWVTEVGKMIANRGGELVVACATFSNSCQGTQLGLCVRLQTACTAAAAA